MLLYGHLVTFLHCYALLLLFLVAGLQLDTNTSSVLLHVKLKFCSAVHMHLKVLVKKCSYSDHIFSLNDTIWVQNSYCNDSLLSVTEAGRHLVHLPVLVIVRHLDKQSGRIHEQMIPITTHLWMQDTAILTDQDQGRWLWCLIKVEVGRCCFDIRQTKLFISF